MPSHLLFPLASSLLFVVGMLLSKAAAKQGVQPMMVLFSTNLAMGLVFAPFWWMGGQIPESGSGWWASPFWQPAIIAMLSIAGMGFTFAAVRVGDVSIATPVFGMKVLYVAIGLSLVTAAVPPPVIWVACAMATAGVILVQWTGLSDGRRTAITIGLASCAAISYASFDVLLQKWAPAWGAGRMLPIMYAMVALLTLPMAWRLDWSVLRNRSAMKWLVPTALLVALQAIGIAGTLSIVGDAARVNIVYSLRGLWGVLLAWYVSRVWGGTESVLSRQKLLIRLAGAGLLTAAVSLALWSH